MSDIVYLGKATADNTSNELLITGLMDGTYDCYEFHIKNLQMATAMPSVTYLYTRISDDNGATWKTGSNYKNMMYYYNNANQKEFWTNSGATATVFAQTNQGTPVLRVSDDLTGGGRVVSGIVRMYCTNDTDKYLTYNSKIVYVGYNNNSAVVQEWGYYDVAATTVNAVQFFMSGGTTYEIEFGDILCYGVL